MIDKRTEMGKAKEMEFPTKPISKRRSLPFASWSRFEVRHLILWTTLVACMIGGVRVWRFLEGAGFAPKSLTSLAGTGEWNEPFRQNEILVAFALGTLLGLGLPATLSPSPGIPFWSHPARVVFGLALAVVTTIFATSLASPFLFPGMVEQGGMILQLGAASTYLVFSIYVLLRSRVGLLWRLALFLWVLMVCLEIASLIIQFGYPMAQVSDPAVVISSTLGMMLVLIGTLMIAGIIELLAGKHKDWRVVSVTLMLPLCLLCFHFPLFDVLYQAYLYDTRLRNSF